jgi:uncharacterized protein YjbI with pentapeptide repeats
LRDCEWGIAVADEEHVKRLLQGVAEWNAWRSHGGAGVSNADFSNADLSNADLSGADLSNANLSGADLTDAHLSFAIHENHNGGNLPLLTITTANLTRANLYGADMSRAHLSNANLTGANLTHADLTDANLTDTHLTDANLGRADLTSADLTRALLSGANLTNADLTDANLSHADLISAKVGSAVLSNTIFVNVNLTSAAGLEKCTHLGPSVIDHRTLQKSGRLPLPFLRGVGLPDTWIENMPTLLGKPAEYYSCFISYSSKDEDFAKRLHADLGKKGVRSWFAPHDLPIGAKILDEIHGAIKLRQKVLLILSEHSIGSDWVEDEVTKAFEEERKRGEVVLFPVRLDNTVMDTSEAWAEKLRARNIGDFRNWKDHDGYKQSFQRVLRDLKIS